MHVRFKTGTIMPRMAVVAALCPAWSGEAVVFRSTDEANHNIAPPATEAVAEAWRLQGRWRGGGGVPVGHRFFLTAKHLGGVPGEYFEFQGVRYTALESFPDRDADLALWKICGAFPEHARLQEDRAEHGRVCAVFGFGHIRGEEVVVEADDGPGGVRGWRWRPGGGRLRWGLNRIAGALDAGDGNGELLYASFDAEGEDEEATLALGDSGSGLFVLYEDGVRLAGVNHAVDGPFRLSEQGAAFDAALLDKRGLFERSHDGEWLRIEPSDAPVPARCFAVRIAARIDWIRAVLETSDAAPEAPLLEVARRIEGPYRVARNVEFDPGAGRIRVPILGGDAFYRLQQCPTGRLEVVGVAEGTLVLSYEPSAPGLIDPLPSATDAHSFALESK